MSLAMEQTRLTKKMDLPTSDDSTRNPNESVEISVQSKRRELFHRAVARSKKLEQPIEQQRREPEVSLPRMVDRNLPFHQSRNSMNMRNSYDRPLLALLVSDWFHTLLRLPACISVNLLLSIWVLMVGLFAVFYWYLDNIHYEVIDCGLGPTEGVTIAFQGAFAFSLETCTTVGYGLPGTSTSFFDKGCNAVQVTVFAEMLWSMLFNAFLFAFFFSLLSKSEFRSSQIIFTKKLLVNVEICNKSNNEEEGNSRAYVRLQCYDIDSAHPLVEAHARMYVLDHKLKMHPLRLMDPNDDLGGMLFPSVPTDIVHHIDHHSPLSPRKLPLVERSNGMVLRSLDSYTGNRDEIICPVCGEAYGTYTRLRKHIRYNAMLEEKEGFPPETSHAGFNLPKIEPLTLEEVRKHIEKTFSEIIVVVEAIDPQLSGTFQSLQSYKYTDIVFGAEFGKCLSTDKEGEEFVVDMRQFHKTCKQGSLNHYSSSFYHKLHSGSSFDSPSKCRDESCAPSFSNISDGLEDGNDPHSSTDRDEETDTDDFDEDEDDEISLENGGTYFRRSYDTFASFRSPAGENMLTNLFTGRRFTQLPTIDADDGDSNQQSATSEDPAPMHMLV